MRAAGAFFLAICLNWLACEAALADKRVALVIGNSAYQGVSKLANPANDSAAIATMIRNAGFDLVELRQNLKINEMRRALRDFADRVRNADIVIVYFAGHGIEIDGVNYLIPVDAVLERDIDAFDEAVSLDRILTVIAPARKLRLVILDACRDNPFSRVMRRTSASRSIDRGLAKIEPTSPNTLVAFAAKAGSIALDGDSGNSPFTDALIRHLPKPGLDLRKAFGFVRDEVLRVTNNRQEPFIYGSLGGEDVPLVAPPRTSAPDADARTRRDYELAERVGTREAWDFFLATYPDGFYAKLAIAQHNKLAAEEARLAAVQSARRTAEEQQRLVSEGARSAEQKRAAELAKAAEEARIAAEKKKGVEEARLAEAEQARAAAQVKAEAAARAAAEKKGLEEAKAAEAARAKAAAEAKVAEAGTAEAGEKPIGQLAALNPPDAKFEKPSQAELPRLLQAELKRVGCSTGAAGDEWNSAAQKALGQFNKNAKKKFDVKVASLEALDSVKSMSRRVCPPVCDHGYRADGDSCSKIVCRAGYELGRDDTCERIREKRVAKPSVNQVEPAAETQNGQRTERPSATNREALYAHCRAKLDAQVPQVYRQRYTIRPDFKKLEHCVASAGR